MQFDDAYRDQIRLADGHQVRFRLIQPADRARLRDGFRKLSAATRQKRFFGGKHGLSDAELRYLTELDQSDHFAIGAVGLDGDGGEGEGMGVARFIRLADDAACAEVAITVIDRMQGKGLGRQLLIRLVEAAVERGVGRFRFECLTHNREIRRLVEKTCEVIRFVNDGDVMVAEVALPTRGGPESAEPAADAFERLFVLLRNFASEALEYQFRLGMGTVRRSIDLAFDKRYFWTGPRQGRSPRDCGRSAD